MLAMLLYVTLGLALVLTCRKPARRLFGAGPAFTLWSLPPLLALLPWLPALPAITPTAWVLPNAPILAANPGPAAATTPWLLLLWTIGSLVCILRLVIHYRQLLRQGRRLPPALLRAVQADLCGLDPQCLRLHPAGPAVLWASHSLLLLPADFLERFDVTERSLVLRHERMHLRRGDPCWSLLAELTFALLWFHPLAWLALPRLRLDQELACDERVLHHSPRDAARYAHTLLHSTGMTTTPALIPWLAEPQLKERLSMIQRQRPGALRRRMGFIGLTALMAGSALVVQVTQARPSASAETNAHASLVEPHPQDASRNKPEGAAILDVHAGAATAPAVKADLAAKASPDPVKAATAAVTPIHSNPATKNSKPIKGDARVPINLNPTPPVPVAPPAAPLPPAPPTPPAPPAPPTAPSHASSNF
jgi:beta-lactamase regulating signal transducer with metallopeptidase domain